MTEVVVQEADEEPKRSLIELVNEELKKLTPEGQKEITLQDIATKLGINILDLYEWLKEDEEFKRGLENYTALDKSIFADENFGNRADAMPLAFLLSEMKKKHSK